jgi:hypothetical protein
MKPTFLAFPANRIGLVTLKISDFEPCTVCSGNNDFS